MKTWSFIALLFGLGSVVTSACASDPPRARVGPGTAAQRLSRSAGPTVQDCGEASESIGETGCRIQPVGECVMTAFKSCRGAHGVHMYFAGEGDPVRVDWFVVEKGGRGGGCEFVMIEDRSNDPLGPQAPEERHCESVTWGKHPGIAGCDVLQPTGCKTTAPTG
jgi:hypothetical protein